MNYKKLKELTRRVDWAKGERRKRLGPIYFEGINPIRDKELSKLETTLTKQSRGI